MTDIFTFEKRSKIMRSVRAKGNRSTELKLVEIFKEHGIKGWRRNYAVYGHPDFVFLKERIAVFVDGCFWHGHECRNIRPKAHEEYWIGKRERNITHDTKVTKMFENRGWTVIRIWECELKKKNFNSLMGKLKPLIECKIE